MAVDLRTTQEYLNDKAGTVGLTKQQALQRLAGAGAIDMTAQDAASLYAGLPVNDRTGVQESLNRKVGVPQSIVPDVSQPTITGSVTVGDNGSGQRLAESFALTRGQLRTVTIQKRNSTGTYTGDVTVSIQGNSAAGSPNGSVIATATIANATWEAVVSNTDVNVSLVAGLAPGVTYWIVVESSTQDASNRANIGGAAGDPSAEYVAKRWNGSAWIVNSTDLYFKTLVAVDERYTEQEAARRL
jgi:hypothetical protein